MADRTVHARYRSAAGELVEVVRYDRSGKWWVETKSGQRSPVTLRTAVFSAVAGRGQIPKGLPGGAAFDRLCEKELGAQS